MARDDTRRQEKAREGTRRHGKAREARGHGMFPTLFHSLIK